ncbi:MAG: hypothetical protein U0992_21130 [Planctomycetaceae bacterium]
MLLAMQIERDMRHFAALEFIRQSSRMARKARHVHVVAGIPIEAGQQRPLAAV